LKACPREFVPRYRWQRAGELAAFYTHAVPVVRRLELASSRHFEALGTEADSFKRGVPKAAIRLLQSDKPMWLKAIPSKGA